MFLSMRKDARQVPCLNGKVHCQYGTQVYCKQEVVTGEKDASYCKSQQTNMKHYCKKS